MAKSEGPAAALLERADNTAKAIERIDHDPEEALHALEPSIKAAPNVGELGMSDMFQLVLQMQQQQHAMQQQIIALTTQKVTSSQQSDRSRELAEEQARDKQQREATLEAWRTEPREPVWLQPEPDEEKIFRVTKAYPPRMFRVNGLEFPVPPGQIVSVPVSIARMVEWSQHRRPASGPPTAIEQIADPSRAQFLAGSSAITLGSPGVTGQGPLSPPSSPPPTPLGYMYDHRGQ